MSSNTLQNLKEHFSKDVGTPELLVIAPGRANIIGEHVDYCQGYVLPFAIEQAMYFLARVRTDDDTVRFYSSDYDQSWSFGESDNYSWSKYLVQLQVLIIERDLACLGVDIYFGSDIPIGAGLSSSSALCCGVISLLSELNGWKLNKKEIIDLASEAEHGTGLMGGKMDQYAIMYGQEGTAILLDCVDHSFETVQLGQGDFAFWILDSGVSHKLVHSEYNLRRAEVYRGLDLLREQEESIAFRTVTVELLNEIELEYPVESRRLRHVMKEIERVQAAVAAMENDIARLGPLMNASHVSLRDNYEVSCPELDFIVERVQALPEVYGARMMGGGFGGSVIALAGRELGVALFDRLKSDYAERFDRTCNVFPAIPCKGLQVISLT